MSSLNLKEWSCAIGHPLYWHICSHGCMYAQAKYIRLYWRKSVRLWTSTFATSRMISLLSHGTFHDRENLRSSGGNRFPVLLGDQTARSGLPKSLSLYRTLSILALVTSFSPQEPPRPSSSNVSFTCTSSISFEGYSVVTQKHRQISMNCRKNLYIREKKSYKFDEIHTKRIKKIINQLINTVARGIICNSSTS